MNDLAPRLLTFALLGALLSACAVQPDATESASASVEHIDGWTDEALDIYFVPGGAAAEDRIAAEIAGATQSIRVAMYNLRSERLGWALLDRQRAGVQVEVLWDAKQMAKDYNTLDDELIAAGLNVVPVHNTRTNYSTLHDKLAVFDGSTVMLGSANWGASALHQNNESLLVFHSTGLAASVDAELNEIASGTKLARTGDDDSRVQLYFSPEDRLDLVTEAAIDAATDRIDVSVFSLHWHALSQALVRAHNRGVSVHVLTDQKQADTTNEDEFLSAAGIEVVAALNAASPYTAMHHKFLVIDGDITLVGSYNWSYTATFGSYEDLAVIAGDTEVAAAFEREMARLWRQYADTPGPTVPNIGVEVRAFCDRTQWGDRLVLVGDIDELGAWDPHAGIELSGDTWPLWFARPLLPAGARVQYKLVIIRSDGSVWWESGANREVVLPTDPNETALVIDDEFRG